MQGAHNGGRVVCSTNGAGKLNIHMTENETGPWSHIIYRMQLKWIKYKTWNNRSAGRKQGKILTVVWGMIFFNITQQKQASEAKIQKWGYIKLNSFCTKRRKNKPTMKRQPIEWEKMFANYLSDKGLISIICE